MASTVKMSPRYVYEDNELGAFNGTVIALYMQLGGPTVESIATPWEGTAHALKGYCNMFCHTLRGIHPSIYPFLASLPPIAEKLQLLQNAYPDPIAFSPMPELVQQFLPLTYKGTINNETTSSSSVATIGSATKTFEQKSQA